MKELKYDSMWYLEFLNMVQITNGVVERIWRYLQPASVLNFLSVCGTTSDSVGALARHVLDCTFRSLRPHRLLPVAIRLSPLAHHFDIHTHGATMSVSAAPTALVSSTTISTTNDYTSYTPTSPAAHAPPSPPRTQVTTPTQYFSTASTPSLPTRQRHRL